MVKRILVAAFCLSLVCSTSFAADEKLAEGEAVAVGKSAPDFEVTGIDGKTFKLSDKLGKGKPVVLMFSRALW